MTYIYDLTARLLFEGSSYFFVQALCAAIYSRAATIQCVATIRVNMVCRKLVLLYDSEFSQTLVVDRI